jgi:hypothetical protein
MIGGWGGRMIRVLPELVLVHYHLDWDPDRKLQNDDWRVLLLQMHDPHDAALNIQ